MATMLLLLSPAALPMLPTARSVHGDTGREKQQRACTAVSSLARATGWMEGARWALAG